MCVCVCVCVCVCQLLRRIAVTKEHLDNRGVCICTQSHPTLCDSMGCSPPAPLSVGFSRQEYWSELPFPLPGDLPDPGTESGSPVSPALAGRFFTLC